MSIEIQKNVGRVKMGDSIKWKARGERSDGMVSIARLGRNFSVAVSHQPWGTA